MWASTSRSSEKLLPGAIALLALAVPLQLAADALEAGAVVTHRDLRWTWSEGGLWSLAPIPDGKASYQVVTGSNFSARAITVGTSSTTVIWLPHLEGSSDASELAVRMLADRGYRVVGLLPPGHAFADGATVISWVALLEERIRAGRATVREFGPPEGCLVLVGLSLGGLAAIPVSVLEDRVDGLVLLLAGADLGELASRLTELAPEFELDSHAPLSRQESVRMSHLEPLRWAARIDRDRTLFIHASFDRVVPRSSSEKLWEALGRPKRIGYPSGHLSFRYFLPLAIRAIGEHVEEVCARKDSLVADPTASSGSEPHG